MMAAMIEKQEVQELFPCPIWIVDLRPADAESKEGRLLIFPAWLKHSVTSNQGQTDRISISFNLMFKNFSETMAAPLWDATAGKEK